MLSSDEFAEWSADKLLFLHVTTRVATDDYQTLLRDKGFRRFPTLAFLDAEGNVIAKHAGDRTLDGVKETAASADKYLGLREQAASGDRVAEATLLVANLELGHYDFHEGTLRLAAVQQDLPAKTFAEAEQILTGIQLDEMVTELRQQLSDERMDHDEYRRKYGELMLLFYDAGRLPAGSRAATVFTGVLNHAETEKDAELYARVLGDLKQRFADDPRWQRRIEFYGQKLEELRGR